MCGSNFADRCQRTPPPPAPPKASFIHSSKEILLLKSRRGLYIIV